MPAMRTRWTTVVVVAWSALGLSGACGDSGGSSPGTSGDAGTPDSLAGASDVAGAGDVAAAPDAGVIDVIEDVPAPDELDAAEDTAEPGPVVCDFADEPAPGLVVHPYLQRAEPTAITVMWETATGRESRVDWGLTSELGETTCGELVEPWEWLDLETMLHGARLEELMPSTRYWYRVTTGGVSSDVHDFITPPPAGSGDPFRLVALSDSQRASAWPDKFREVVEDGVIAYTHAHYGDLLAEELAMVILSGDLVDQGWSFEQWPEELFLPMRALLRHVPFYPALGNHEGNSLFYFRYFDLPLNGTEGFEEHWYTVDYANLRLVTLDSNGGYQNQEQLDWLDSVLEASCTDDTIDFVFAQLHHPHLSELWTPGNTDYTGEVIARLETFSTACGKPSIHFFGHTHGYSRGQSRDHAHVMVNVASAGGAIDRWGEHEAEDYDAFTVSHDDWGFVIVDVEGGDDPYFHMQRLSRGNADDLLDNVLRDELVVRRYNQPPDTPVPASPSGAIVCPPDLPLVASPFGDPDGDGHQGAHWQIAATCDGFDAPLGESWRQRQNWFMGVDLAAGEDLTDELLADALPATPPDGALCWRVRYRDEALAWSAWSVGTAITCEP